LKLDSILRIYSMSKPIITVAAMTLYEQGRFNLDDPVARFIPAFSNATVIQKDGDTIQRVAPKRQVSIRDVLRHTTGYSYGDETAVREFYKHEGLRYWGPASMFPPRMTIEKAAEALARIPALHHPGERFTYGFSTDLLGRLIEVWSGQPLEEFLRRAMLEPLEMVDTSFSVPKEKRPRFTSCHTLRDGKFMVVDKSSASPFNEGFEFLSGGGGLVSTVRDYANFCQMLVDGGQFKGRRLLQEDSIKLMFTDQLNGAAGGFRFGLGFAISEVKLGSGESQRKATQYSWGGYASTDFRLVPSERLFQIVARQQVPDSHDLADRLFAIVYSGATSAADTARKATATSLNWQPLAPMLEERFEHGCALVGDVLYVFGGFGKGVKTSKHVMAFDLSKNAWRRLQDMPSALDHLNPVVDGRSVWMAGGFKDGYPGKAIDEVWKYDVNKDSFVAGPSLPGPRAGGGLALVGRRLHYLGGLMDRDNDSADHWVLELDTTGTAARWKNAAPMPAPRNQFGTVVVQGKIYVIGGQFHHDTRSGQPALDQTRVDLYDPATDSWSPGPELPVPHSHSENGTFLYEGQIYVIGGRSVDRVETAICVLSPVGEWRRFGDLPVALIGPAARIIDGRLVVAGGAPRGFDPLPTVWAQDRRRK
jgi:CubicO group peptidase (beta-lactamase class C family)